MSIFSVIDDPGFLPLGQCYGWDAHLILTNVISDSLTAVCYLLIPLGIFRFLAKKGDASYNGFTTLIAAAVFLNGVLKIFDVLKFWQTEYFVDSALRLLTAGVSLLVLYYYSRHVDRLFNPPPHANSVTKMQSENEQLQERELMMNRFLDSTLDREDRILELKKEVNELCSTAGVPVRYRE
jgi:hypothetical protein